MEIEEALSVCEDTVRRFDPDRYFASLFAPSDKRPLLFALYAFNYEVARVGELSREPMMGAIRLQWWREALYEAREGRPREHPVTIGLAEMFARAAPGSELIESLLDAREYDLTADGFADLAALETYCEATSSGLMGAAADLLGGDPGDSAILKHAGIAYAIAGLVRAIAFHAARRKLYLPLEMLSEERLLPEDIFAGRNVEPLKCVMQKLASRAREHMASARGAPVKLQRLPALLPAALVSLYLRRVTRQSFDPFRRRADVALFRRLLALLCAAMLRKI